MTQEACANKGWTAAYYEGLRNHQPNTGEGMRVIQSCLPAPFERPHGILVLGQVALLGGIGRLGDCTQQGLHCCGALVDGGQPLRCAARVHKLEPG